MVTVRALTVTLAALLSCVFGSALDLFARTLPSHNIDISPLDRNATLTPSRKLCLRGDHGAISSDSQLCNELVHDKIVLKFPESNAADHAVTLALCLGMVHFFNSGVGGGGYAVVHNHGARGGDWTADFRETAPRRATEDMFSDPSQSKVGGLAVAVPGELSGAYELYRSMGSGTVQWAQLLEPVITLGNDGWPVGEALEAALVAYESVFLAVPDSWGFVLNSTRTGVLRRGDWIKRPALANTLQILATNGSAAPFYDPRGPLVESMVRSVASEGGLLAPEDFADYTVHVTPALKRRIRCGFAYAPDNDLTVVTSSGSSSGAALLSALGIMDVNRVHPGGDYTAKTTFQLVEAMKWMASARSRLGDYEGVELPARIAQLLEDKWIKNAIQSTAERNSTMANYTAYEPLYEINEPHGTAHFSVVDSRGNAVSLTTTINLLFGSLVHDTTTGVIFNNEMDDFAQRHRSNSFDLAPSAYNLIAPGKRPLSSTAPTVVLNEYGRPDLVIGASGGSRITTSILQGIIRQYWYQMPLLETVAYPRVHHQLLPDVLEVESRAMMGKEIVGELQAMGYTVREAAPKSVLNAIKRVGTSWAAVSDYWRKRGVAVAY
ncbi:gamma-glutamyltransferase KNAG_0F03210 [Huiozyma naganishii CBS 8797]|uniref:Glutathione hydrolase n=1 Tax=Huiozyma naganishii (strain ATCC MYA-139 / BCRC 22969 / CBS 8797 / KCTC 17520 / NBRC 10181 / NCYC 3082 / Yp74L-3) TaxID=1071383 RepID=J7RN78_HUIN7|nr:hypothetical protein KNAG_0F03210 [Kazachstania naganishii CBS 8797]CCK70983.1 hypothetical protein KNAG_0F03210 [Kazachstania naganishii CBS 8797]